MNNSFNNKQLTHAIVETLSSEDAKQFNVNAIVRLCFDQSDELFLTLLLVKDETGPPSQQYLFRPPKVQGRNAFGYTDLPELQAFARKAMTLIKAKYSKVAPSSCWIVSRAGVEPYTIVEQTPAAATAS